MEPGCHYPCDAQSGVNSTDEEEKLLTKLEIDTGAGKGTDHLKKKNLQKSSAKVSPSLGISIFHLFILVPPSSRSIFFSNDECDDKRG